jgi:hypothetical protein
MLGVDCSRCPGHYVPTIESWVDILFSYKVKRGVYIVFGGFSPVFGNFSPFLGEWMKIPARCQGTRETIVRFYVLLKNFSLI